MHQILGLRPYFNEKKQKWEKTDNTFFKRNWRFASLADLFKQLERFLEPIPVGDRWNLYYTVAFCTEKKREFREQTVIAFDIDAINDTDPAKYHPLVCKALGIDATKTGIVSSGNGLHYLVAVQTPIVDPLFFDRHRVHYDAICERIQGVLQGAGLPGKPDPSVFDPRRILRLPGTINRKEGKPDKQCRILQANIEPQDFSLVAVAGIPQVAAAEQITDQVLKKYPPPDEKAVLSGCEFLKHCKEKPNEVSEAQWYAMLSILGRLGDNASVRCHEYSSGHHGYTPGETESKLSQALRASGPRTCDGINKLWAHCNSCPNFGKVTSPIVIQSADFIKTETTGFHSVYVDQNGTQKVGKPQFEDLRRFFARKHRYIVTEESRTCYIWTGTHWKVVSYAFLEAFAQKHFNPIADNKMAMEFRGVVIRNNNRPAQWFVDTTHGHMNFRNGVLDLITMQLHPHSPEFGFTHVLDYNYDPVAQAPRFEQFLMEVMNQRLDLVAILTEFLGYSFSSDDCYLEKALLLSGEGANGKSTFIKILQELAGKGNYSSLTLGDLKHEVSRQQIEGKLFNLAEETPTYAMIDSNIFKTLVSGGEVMVKTLYKQPYSVKNRAKLIFACNELPRTKDATHGYFRKLTLIPFDRKFEGKDKDPFLLSKLREELPGIFNLVIQGYRRLREQGGFTESETVGQELNKYREDVDTVTAWFSDCVNVQELNPDSKVMVTLPDLYAAYRMYAEAAGERPETRAMMCRRLNALVPDYKKRQFRKDIQGRKITVYRCIGFAEEGNL